MPASEAQIRANQANAMCSQGPTTEAGKARSRLNATKHGLASQLADVDVEIMLSPQFEDRREKWAAEQNPVGEAGHWALDRAVAASLRIERCEQTIDQIITDVKARARLTWDQDRSVEAASIAGRLAKNPVLAARQLQTSWAGASLMVEAWLGLLGSLEDGDWSESEASKALDLLGVDAELRSGRTLIDASEEADPVTFRRSLALEEVDRLEQLRDEALGPLDDLDRKRAVAGASALLSKPAKLALRYERDAWKRYWDSMNKLKAQAQVQTQPQPQTQSPTLAPKPVSVPVSTPLPPPEPVPPDETIEEEPQAEPAEPATIGRAVLDRPVATSLANDPAWAHHFDRRIDGPTAIPVDSMPTSS